MNAAPNSRNGKKTGPRRVRMTAMVRPNTVMRTAQTSSTRMLSHSPLSTAGNDATALSQSKNVSWTRGHPDECVSTHPSAPTTRIVLIDAMAADRTVRERR